MKERKILFTAHSKLIARCLPFLLSFVLCFYLLCFESNAAVISNIDWTSQYCEDMVHFTFTKNKEDGRLISSGTSIDTYQFVDRIETVYYFNYYVSDGSMILKHDNTAISHDFQLNYGNSSNVVPSNLNYEYSLIIASTEYPMSGPVGWVNKLSIQGNSSYMTLKVKVSCDITYSMDFNKTVTSNTKTCTLAFQSQLNLFDQYSMSDIGTVLNSKVDTLLSEIPVIEGAIREETQNQTDTLTNGYDSSNMGDAESKFNDSASDLTGIEDTLSDSSTQYVDTFTSTGFDDSLLDNIAPSMQYVVTWFTNFWNMGGALTKCFTLCFALYIAFYILRVRS